MLDVIKAIKDPANVTPEQITQAYEILKEYCDANDTDVLTVVNNDDNIKPASIEIHKNLPWVVRKAISADKIENLITTNIEFIREKAQEMHDLEHGKNKKSKKKK